MSLARLLVALTCGLVLSVSTVGLAAQEEEDDTCMVLIEEALAQVGDACSGISRNQACYGHNMVAVTNFDGAAPASFSTSGDIIAITELATLSTAPLEVDTGIWGVALLSLQANLPNTLPGQNVTFVVFGDAELVSEVPPEKQATLPTLSAQPTVSINLRCGPGTGYAVVGALTPGAEITLTRRNDAGDWAQFMYEDSVAWVYLSLLTIEGDVDGLPIIEGTGAADIVYSAPMQAFRLTAGIGAPACESAPRDGLLIQAPTDTTVHFRINGVEVTVGSTALLLLDDTGQLDINTFEGKVDVTAAGVTQTVEPGYQVRAAADLAPTEPEPYDYANVQNTLVTILPEPVGIPITVPAVHEWLDTGITLEPGQVYTITASGFIDLWVDCETDCPNTENTPNCDYVCANDVTGPEGTFGAVGDMPPGETYAQYDLKSAFFGELIGRIGDGGPFIIGSGGTFIADRSGMLRLKVNEDNTPDNGGAFIVIVDTAG